MLRTSVFRGAQFLRQDINILQQELKNITKFSLSKRKFLCMPPMVYDKTTIITIMG
jgi:hypothetical protein